MPLILGEINLIIWRNIEKNWDRRMMNNKIEL